METASLEALAAEMNALGWTATLVTWLDGTRALKIEECRALRSPKLRRDRFVWDGYSAKSPKTMAARLNRFLLEGGVKPSR